MALILNIETAMPTCAVAISKNGVLIAEKMAAGRQTHANDLTLLIQSSLNECQLELSDLDAVAVSEGPGSYTGLRIGLSTAKGICYALGKPLIAVNTLAALASAASQQVEGDFWTFCPLIDARRMEVYTAVFDKNLNELEPPQALIVENDDFWAAYFAEKNKVLFFGDGAAKCEAVILHEKALFLQSVQAIRGVIPLATAAFEAQKFQDVAYFEPFYLKSPNITKPKQILKPIY